ncbi:cytochrome b/b6 domain-containing protein [Thalassomonas actiniarum]|uniref:Cytochrome b/b6 domain-containing protein n=1 Tax=Thalassomonas actiniarum TaxID=485447 RepID=A0AAE9YS11_9GAMM|nr:cytochrome b/b6 domain-containing protein [Thalassomonas actiniarum]WDE00006.1 cytochrome b/b6 domain-containing protein [Thalassomonas actiniarum]
MTEQYQPIRVWSRKIRFFHWLNLLCILLLTVIGLMLLNGKLLGLSVDGKILLKTFHVITGYVFALNLVLRIVLGFLGKGYERWGQTLPFNQGYRQELSAFRKKQHLAYKGHNPLGKLMVAALLFFMSVQMITGLVLAGTDIYYPPFGSYVAAYIAEDSNKLDEIKPYSKVNINELAYQEMRSLRKPVITVHIYSFYTLMVLIIFHILGVVIAERREKTALVSAMINGYKYLPGDKQDK